MPKLSGVVNHIEIKVNGTSLSKAQQVSLLEAVVDQHALLPGMFSLRFLDPDLKLLDEGPFDFQAKVEIGARDANDTLVPLIQGEITALEPEFGAGMKAELVVRGYDLSHRLYRKTRSTTYLNVKDSDLATQFAQSAHLTAVVDATKTVYEHLYQHNMSDLSYLQQRAWRIGYECFVNGDKLYFRKPKVEDGKATFTWGKELETFHPRMTQAEQVEKVIVKGWDIQKREVIIGRAEKPTLLAKAGNGANSVEKTEQKLAKDGELVIVDQVVTSQAEADILAAARLDEIAGSFVEAEGSAHNAPQIQAGRVIKVDGLGKRFSGNYLVTHAQHSYTDTGLQTVFMVKGLRTGLLLAQFSDNDITERWQGVAPAIVTNSDDPKKWGRIKVKYPWMSDEDESDWMRVTSSGAGPTAGFCNIPAVNDEVLVSFINGQFDQPIVLGGLWNGLADPPPEVLDAPKGEKPKVSTWRTQKGHRITLYDTAKNKIEAVTVSGHELLLNDADKHIQIKSAGGNVIKIDDSGKQIEVKSAGGLKINMNDNGREITIESGGNVTVKATQMMTLEASGNLQVKAGGMLDLQASGAVTIKGATVSLN